MALRNALPSGAKHSSEVSEDKVDPATVSKEADVTVFENFTIAGTVDNATLATYADKSITVTAYAIQADGFEGKTASEIWNATGFGN